MKKDVLLEYVYEFGSGSHRISDLTMLRNSILRSPKGCVFSYDFENDRRTLKRNMNATDEEVLETFKDIIRDTSIEEFKSYRNIGNKSLEIIKKMKDSLSVESEMGAYI